MPIPDFFSPDDSVKYLKNFEENTDSYLAALGLCKGESIWRRNNAR